MLSLEELAEVTLFRRHYAAVLARYPGLAGKRLIYEIVRRMINEVVTDLIDTTSAAIATAAPADIDAVRKLPEMLVGFGSTVAAEHLELKQFLRKNLYRHYRVLRMTTKANKVVQALFAALMEKPELMPPEHWVHAQKLQGDAGDAGRARAVADYIAGMTDRFAILEYDRLFDPSERT